MMRDAAAMRTLDSWHAHMEIGQMLEWIQEEVDRDQLGKREAKEAEKDIAKARTRDSTRVLTRLGEERDGALRIAADPPLVVPIEDLVLPGTTAEATEDSMRRLLRSYRRTLRVPTSSRSKSSRTCTPRARWWGWAAWARVHGSCCSWVAMTTTRLFLQAKEAQASVLERFVGRSEFSHHGRRVVEGQRLMQAASDIFLGWQRVVDLDGETRDYYVRQLHDWKGSAEVDTMRVPGATLYARMCGATLARAHARWGDRIAIASYLGQERGVRPRHRRLLRGLRRPERAGLSGAGRRRRGREDHGADGCLTRLPNSDCQLGQALTTTAKLCPRW